MPKRKSRKSILEERLSEARNVAVASTYDCIIVGGGAAGIVCAIEAARKGFEVLILEQELIAGKKILTTGNGRCNFSNERLDTSCYTNKEFVASTFSNTPEKDIQSFFKSLGLTWISEEGRLYPRSLCATTIRDLLLAEAKRLGITIACGRHVIDIQRKTDWIAVYHFGDEPKRYTVSTPRLVIATGGGASDCLKGLSIYQAPYKPVLCALETSPKPERILNGRRISAQACIIRNGKCITQESGEILFRDYGVSGIAVFNLSRFAEPGDTLLIDALCDMDIRAVRAHLNSAPDLHSGLIGLIDPHLAELAFDTADPAAYLKCIEFEIRGYANIDAAQVMRGGIRTNQLNPHTLEALLYPGLYIVGEALDIDAACGGYNLSWAWISGLRAAQSFI